MIQLDPQERIKDEVQKKASSSLSRHIIDFFWKKTTNTEGVMSMDKGLYNQDKRAWSKEQDNLYNDIVEKFESFETIRQHLDSCHKDRKAHPNNTPFFSRGKASPFSNENMFDRIVITLGKFKNRGEDEINEKNKITETSYKKNNSNKKELIKSISELVENLSKSNNESENLIGSNKEKVWALNIILEILNDIYDEKIVQESDPSDKNRHEKKLLELINATSAVYKILKEKKSTKFTKILSRLLEVEVNSLVRERINNRKSTYTAEVNGIKNKVKKITTAIEPVANYSEEINLDSVYKNNEEKLKNIKYVIENETITFGDIIKKENKIKKYCGKIANIQKEIIYGENIVNLKSNLKDLNDYIQKLQSNVKYVYEFSSELIKNKEILKLSQELKTLGMNVQIIKGLNKLEKIIPDTEKVNEKIKINSLEKNDILDINETMYKKTVNEIGGAISIKDDLDKVIDDFSEKCKNRKEHIKLYEKKENIQPIIDFDDQVNSEIKYLTSENQINKKYERIANSERFKFIVKNSGCELDYNKKIFDFIKEKKAKYSKKSTFFKYYIGFFLNKNNSWRKLYEKKKEFNKFEKKLDRKNISILATNEKKIIVNNGENHDKFQQVIDAFILKYKDGNLAKKISPIKEEINDKKNEVINNFDKLVSDARSKLKRPADGDMKELKEKVENLTRVNNELHSDLEKVCKEKEDNENKFNGSIKEKNIQIDGLMEQINLNANQMQESKDLIEILKKSIDESNNKSLHKKNELQEVVKLQEKKIKDISDKENQISKSLTQTENHLKRLKIENQNLGRELLNLKKSNGNYKKMEQDYVVKIQKKGDEIKGKEDEIKRKGNEIAALQNEKNRMNADLEYMKKMNEKISKELQKKNNEFLVLQNQNKFIKNELEATRISKEEVLQNSNEKEVNIVTMKQKISNLNNQNVSLKENHESKLVEISSLQQLNKDLVHQGERTKREILTNAKSIISKDLSSTLNAIPEDIFTDANPEGESERIRDKSVIISNNEDIQDTFSEKGVQFVDSNIEANKLIESLISKTLKGYLLSIEKEIERHREIDAEARKLFSSEVGEVVKGVGVVSISENKITEYKVIGFDKENNTVKFEKEKDKKSMYEMIIKILLLQLLESVFTNKENKKISSEKFDALFILLYKCYAASNKLSKDKIVNFVENLKRCSKYLIESKSHNVFGSFSPDFSPENISRCKVEFLELVLDCYEKFNFTLFNGLKRMVYNNPVTGYEKLVNLLISLEKDRNKMQKMIGGTAGSRQQSIVSQV